MGRGRAKAKQTKVARELKYGGPKTDFDRLQAELAGGGGVADHAEHIVDPVTELDTAHEVVEDPYAEDPYAKYYDEDDDDDASAASR
ncbi:MAG: DUF3073 domain-containing protein [Actinobacteria bacterium]|jgi:hypothetical protein|nr:DUF3073 domain-containing protein [Actinomycetota bacterium]